MPSGAPLLKRLYGRMQSMENAIGGGEGVDGLYGSITEVRYWIQLPIMHALYHDAGMVSPPPFPSLPLPRLHYLCSLFPASSPLTSSFLPPSPAHSLFPLSRSPLLLFSLSHSLSVRSLFPHSHSPNFPPCTHRSQYCVYFG